MPQESADGARRFAVVSWHVIFSALAFVLLDWGTRCADVVARSILGVLELPPSTRTRVLLELPAGSFAGLFLLVDAALCALLRRRGVPWHEMQQLELVLLLLVAACALGFYGAEPFLPV